MERNGGLENVKHKNKLYIQTVQWFKYNCKLFKF